MNQNPNSLEEAYTLYFHRVVGFIYKMSKNETVALDCAQEAFRVLSQRNISEVGNVLNWLFLCSKHRYFKYKAKMDRFVFVENYEDFESAFKTEENPQKDLTDKETFDSTCEITEKLLKKLSEKQRKAIKLRFFNNLSYKEIAKKLKTTENNVGFNICAGIKNLRKQFFKYKANNEAFAN
jgi:RNA polymerase sigma-70 factor (ECF subfamily)